MTRYTDWSTRLHAYLASAAQRQFEYGRFDCVHHSANAVLTMTGIDIASEVRGKYDSFLTSHKALKPYGGTVELATAAIALKYNLPEGKPLFAQRGDLVVLEQDGESLSGIVDLSGLISAATQKGYLLVSLNKATRAWRV